MVGTERLFEQALGITSPWTVKLVRFDPAAHQLTIEVGLDPVPRRGWDLILKC
jgi:hypothetical protein